MEGMTMMQNLVPMVGDQPTTGTSAAPAGAADQPQSGTGLFSALFNRFLGLAEEECLECGESADAEEEKATAEEGANAAEATAGSGGGLPLPELIAQLTMPAHVWQKPDRPSEATTAAPVVSAPNIPVSDLTVPATDVTPGKATDPAATARQQLANGQDPTQAVTPATTKPANPEATTATPPTVQAGERFMVTTPGRGAGAMAEISPAPTATTAAYPPGTAIPTPTVHPLAEGQVRAATERHPDRTAPAASIDTGGDEPTVAQTIAATDQTTTSADQAAAEATHRQASAVNPVRQPRSVASHGVGEAAPVTDDGEPLPPTRLVDGKPATEPGSSVEAAAATVQDEGRVNPQADKGMMQHETPGVHLVVRTGEVAGGGPAQMPAAAEAKGLESSHAPLLEQVRDRLVSELHASGERQVTLRLHPEDLGELQIRLRLNEQLLKVEIVAENRGVRDVLVNNLDNLREMLSRQNITVERFDVATGGHRFEAPSQGGGESAGTPFRSQTGRYSEPRLETQVAAGRVWEPAGHSLVDLRL